jgi:hypothetical protein
MTKSETPATETFNLIEIVAVNELKYHVRGGTKQEVRDHAKWLKTMRPGINLKATKNK